MSLPPTFPPETLWRFDKPVKTVSQMSLQEQAQAYSPSLPEFRFLADAIQANPDLLISAIMAKLGERTVELTAQDIANARYMRPAMQVIYDGSVKIRNFSTDSGF